MPPVKKSAKKPAKKRSPPDAAPPSPPPAPDRDELRQKAKRLRELARAAERAAGGKADRHREVMADRSRAASATRREIGPLPAAADPARKESCRFDLKLFCETYLKGTFNLPWCPDHLAAIDRLQTCVLSGGLFAFAMPRGYGKTALCEAGSMFAVLYGHRQFVAFIGSSEEAAKESLLVIRTEFETNDLLGDDFPEVCYPIRCLEGISHRANGQTLDGRRTRMVWTDTKAVMPTVAGSPASGARVRVAGITGRVRGMKAKTAGGESIRPDLAIVDDPQTDESAFSLAQSAKRLRILNGAVLGLAGPKKKIAVFMPCTVIAPNDMADRALDRNKNPAWQGQRSRMVLSWPANQPLWDRYTELRKTSQRSGGSGGEATDFYRANRAAMDEGAAVSWPEHFDPDELSGVQHAMNMLADRGRVAFNAEGQNDPDPPDLEAIDNLDADAIAAKVNDAKRGTVPAGRTRLTAFIDVGNKVLFWCVCAFDDSFAGSVVDYGTFPKQNRAYFAAEDARPALSDVPGFGGFNENARLYAGLKETAALVLGRDYPRADKASGESSLRVERCLVDSGKWGDVVRQFCRQSPFRDVLTASKGWGIGSGRSPMETWKIDPARDRRGDHWVMKHGAGGRLVIFDANHWKSFAAKALLTPEAGTGCLNLFGADPQAHQLFADHLTAEYRSGSHRSKVGDQSEQELWSVRPERRDNHWWDCLVGSFVAASFAGVRFSAAGAAGEPVEPRRKKPKRDLLAEFHAQATKGGLR